MPAKIAKTMISVGLEPMHCPCDREGFENGEVMTALVNADTGESLGWWCQRCLGRLKKRKEEHFE